MAVTQKKQSAFTYDEFRERYEFLLNDRSVPYEQRCDAWQELERKYPKLYSRYMLLTGFGKLSEGGTVWLNVRKHSRTGYSKSISVYSFDVDKHYGIRQASLTYHVARLMGYTCHDYEGFHVVRTDDYPQEFVAHLAQALFGIEKANALHCEVL